ncbi:hypothetical protein OROGR_027740 [Orobanche gracilis]
MQGGAVFDIFARTNIFFFSIYVFLESQLLPIHENSICGMNLILDIYSLVEEIDSHREIEVDGGFDLSRLDATAAASR